MQELTILRGYRIFMWIYNSDFVYCNISSRDSSTFLVVTLFRSEIFYSSLSVVIFPTPILISTMFSVVGLIPTRLYYFRQHFQ